MVANKTAPRYRVLANDLPHCSHPIPRRRSAAFPANDRKRPVRVPPALFDLPYPSRLTMERYASHVLKSRRREW